jgi:hypothetical protein
MIVKEKKNDAQVTKILKGLDLAYENLLKEKKTKNSGLVVLQNNKIITIKP